MLKEAMGTGETIDLAKKEAYKNLAVDSESVNFEVVQIPVKKVLGFFGGKDAIVRAYIEEEESPDVKAEKYICDVLKGIGIHSLKIEKEISDTGVDFSLNGDDISFIVGRHGEVLDALQYLAGLVANAGNNSYYRVNINIGDYRQNREKALQKLAKSIAIKAIKSKRAYPLEPMNPYERKIIHNEVQKINGAYSWSEGHDLNRHIVISNRLPRNKSGNFRNDKPINKTPETSVVTEKLPLYTKIINK